MAFIAVYTDQGEQVWSSPVHPIWIRRVNCPGNNTIGNRLIRELRDAVVEAETREKERGSWA